MEEEGHAIVCKGYLGKPLEGETFRPLGNDFRKLGEWIAKGYAAGLVTVVDSTARVIEPEEEGASDD